MCPTKEQLEAKWWHRLVKVLILITSIGVLGAILFAGIADINSSPTTDYVFSFEPDYSQVKGNEINLKTCSFLILTSALMNDFEKTVKNGSYYDKLGIAQSDLEKTKRETRLGTKYFDGEKFSELVKSIPSLMKVKVVKDYDYEWLPVVLIFSLIGGSVIYFGLWLIYKKIILYIAFGSKIK